MAWSYTSGNHNSGWIEGWDLQVEWWNSWQVAETTLASNGNIRLIVNVHTGTYWTWFRRGGTYICYAEDSITCGSEKVIIRPRGYAGYSYSTVIEVPRSWAGKNVTINIAYKSVTVPLGVTPAYPLAYTAEPGASCIVRRTHTNFPTVAAPGNLASGALLYPGDVIQVTYSVGGNYQLMHALVNGNLLSSGATLTVNSAINIIVATKVREYTLTLRPGSGSNISVYRLSSPYKHAAVGDIGSGTVYSGDVLRIQFAPSNRYQLKTSTVNSKPFLSGNSVTVSENLLVEATAGISDYSFVMAIQDPAAPREAKIDLTYNGKSAAEAGRYFDSFTYTDVASGSSDKVSFSFTDRDRKWINAWFPKKGDKLAPVIVLEDWRKQGQGVRFPCGTFEVDDFSFKGGPIRLSLDALAISSGSGFKTTKRSVTYENTTIQAIGQSLCARNGLILVYEAGTVAIEKVAQNNEDDCAFFNSLTIRFGLAMKIYSDRLVVFDEADYESRAPIATLTEEDFEPGWSWNTKMHGTYTGVRYEYANSEKNLTFTVEAGSGSRILTSNEASENLTEATRIALAALNNANKGTTTLKITLKEEPKFFASGCIQIDGMGKLSGKYFIEEAKHSIGRSTASKLSLTLRRVESRVRKATAYSTTVDEQQKVVTVTGKTTISI